MRPDFRSFFWGFNGGDDLMAMRVFSGIMVVTLVFSLAVCAVFLVFRGLGLQRMAQRKNIPHGWMGYVPLLNLYLLGKVSNMPDKRRRSEIAMLVLGILSFLSLAICLLNIVPILGIAVNTLGRYRLDYDGAANMFSLAVAMFAASIFSAGFAVALDVIRYIALNRIYKQFSPDNATVMTVFTVLGGILVAPIYPFMLFAIRNNEIWPMGKPPASYTGQYPPNIPKYTPPAYNAAATGAAPQNTGAPQLAQESDGAYESQSAPQNSYTATTIEDTGLRPPPEPTVSVPDQPEEE